MTAAVLKMPQENKEDSKLDARSRARRSCIASSISSFAMLEDYGFSLVTCADWLWELVGWVCLASVVQTPACYLFVMLWAVWHATKAGDRHGRYL